jgi:hypothetical protein
MVAPKTSWHKTVASVPIDRDWTWGLLAFQPGETSPLRVVGCLAPSLRGKLPVFKQNMENVSSILPFKLDAWLVIKQVPIRRHIQESTWERRGVVKVDLVG